MDHKELVDIKLKIEDALNKIRPYLNEDGGDVELVDVDQDKNVKIRLVGACNNCPMSMQTLKLGVEQTIKRFVPDVKEVNEIE
jgi:Fe-S cluster biogenesis protein NfuA